MFLEFLLGMTLTVIGDSQGGIVTPYLRKDYIVIDEHKDGARVSGTCSKNLNLNGEIAIIFLGSNHYDDNRVPDVSCVLKMVDNTKKCIWVGPPQIRGHKWAHENELKNQVQNTCVYISTQDITDLPDGIHFGKSGIINIVTRIKSLL
jgi:hypothetical protein